LEWAKDSMRLSGWCLLQVATELVKCNGAHRAMHVIHDFAKNKVETIKWITETAKLQADFQFQGMT